MKKWALILTLWLLIFAVLGVSGAGAEEVVRSNDAALAELHGKFFNEFSQLFFEWVKENKIAFASWQITSNFSRDRKGRPFFWIRILLNGGARDFVVFTSILEKEDEIRYAAGAAMDIFKKSMARELQKSVF